MSILQVQSEIGRLKKVLLHRPGKELENLTPKMLDKLLFDDIPWLDLAQQEHDAFAKILIDHGVEVLYLEDLVADTLKVSLDIKDQFIKQFIKEANVLSETLSEKLTEYLHSFTDVKEMVQTTMGGIKKSDIPNYRKRSLTDYIRDYPFATDPMPNLYFTRDAFTVIDRGIAINRMYSQTRSRESLYGDFIFKYHPIYQDNSIEHYYNRELLPSIEGGDILVLNENLLAIGVSQRTHPAAIERLAKNILYNSQTAINKILAFNIPKVRSFMHLDTVFTQIDQGVFLTHHGANKEMDVYEISKHPHENMKLLITPISKKLSEILEQYLQTKIKIIYCGGDDEVTSDREQWNDGANSLAIAPGEVIVYQRNHITNDILRANGVKVYPMPSCELSRGRGGPRCMSMPFYRDKL